MRLITREYGIHVHVQVYVCIYTQRTRQESIRLEQAVGVHWKEFEALGKNELTGRRLAGTMFPIT